MSGECDKCGECLMDCVCLKRRRRKKTDQENIEFAYQLLHKLIEEHPEIEPTLWAGAIWSALARNYARSGFTYQMFREEVLMVVEHYEQWFE